MQLNSAQSIVKTRYWHRLDDGRLQCDLCPRHCHLREGQRGLCYVRQRLDDEIKLVTYGRSSGFCIDPIEKKPLNHYFPGSAVLSFGTAGCNLACKFCQNWDMSKSREMDTLADAASAQQLARRARAESCRSVAFTYNDPIILHEYDIDVAGIHRVEKFDPWFGIDVTRGDGDGFNVEFTSGRGDVDGIFVINNRVVVSKGNAGATMGARRRRDRLWRRGRGQRIGFA